jgi:hypothetical protein
MHQYCILPSQCSVTQLPSRLPLWTPIMGEQYLPSPDPFGLPLTGQGHPATPLGHSFAVFILPVNSKWVLASLRSDTKGPQHCVAIDARRGGMPSY